MYSLDCSKTEKILPLEPSLNYSNIKKSIYRQLVEAFYNKEMGPFLCSLAKIKFDAAGSECRQTLAKLQEKFVGKGYKVELITETTSVKKINETARLVLSKEKYLHFSFLVSFQEQSVKEEKLKGNWERKCHAEDALIYLNKYYQKRYEFFCKSIVSFFKKNPNKAEYHIQISSSVLLAKIAGDLQKNFEVSVVEFEELDRLKVPEKKQVIICKIPKDFLTDSHDPIPFKFSLS